MLVASGGRLVYATCSVLREENEAQVNDFLAGHEEFRLLPIGEIWRAVLGGACPAEGEMLRLTPARHGTDGFFVAVLERTPGDGSCFASAPPAPRTSRRSPASTSTPGATLIPGATPTLPCPACRPPGAGCPRNTRAQGAEGREESRQW